MPKLTKSSDCVLLVNLRSVEVGFSDCHLIGQSNKVGLDLYRLAQKSNMVFRWLQTDFIRLRARGHRCPQTGGSSWAKSPIGIRDQSD